MTRASSSDDIGDDFGDEGRQCRRKQSGTLEFVGIGRTNITTKREPREVRGEQSGATEQQVPRRISGRTIPQEHAVAVSTQKRHWTDTVKKH